MECRMTEIAFFFHLYTIYIYTIIEYKYHKHIIGRFLLLFIGKLYCILLLYLKIMFTQQYQLFQLAKIRQYSNFDLYNNIGTVVSLGPWYTNYVIYGKLSRSTEVTSIILLYSY